MTVERPLRLRYNLSAEQRRRLKFDAVVLKLKDGRADELSAALETLAAKAPWDDDAKFFAALERAAAFRIDGQGKLFLVDANGVDIARFAVG